MKSLLVLLLTFAACNCIPQLDTRIVGGYAVTIDHFPYQASVRVFDRFICGGCILDAYTILTAAHCVFGMNSYFQYYSIRVGATIHNEGSYIRIARIIMHENYTVDPMYGTHDNDLAILKLSTPLSFNSRVQPIKLQPQGLDVPPGTIALVTGWGATEERNSILPMFLRAVDVRVLPKEECANRYTPVPITSHMLCAQDVKKDACQGDSGGPLVSNGRLIGVVSWGYGCARPQYPGVYAKVSDLYSWITKNKL